MLSVGQALCSLGPAARFQDSGDCPQALSLTLLLNQSEPYRQQTGPASNQCTFQIKIVKTHSHSAMPVQF